MIKKDIGLLRNEIIRKTIEYSKLKKLEETKFIPGESEFKYAGRVFNEGELCNAVEASLDFWLTEGKYAKMFVSKIQNYLGIRNVLLTNSGSSANLLAISALTSDKLGAKRLKPGDEVISAAAGFPATITPILQNGLVPVFVDIEIPTYNICIEMVKKAITPKTRCIFLAHTLGNPFDIDAIMQIAQKNDLWVIEDNCDAFGSEYKGKKTGTFGHLSTISFYPAHHITTGEGGAVCTNLIELANIVRSFRDWGRDCYCSGGANDTCGKRFSQQFGKLPFGFDHKYVYSEVGYNMKMTDIQASIGVAQMDKLPYFCSERKKNFNEWKRIFSKYSDYFIFPEKTIHTDPAWFAFLVTLKKGTHFRRDEFTAFLSKNLIETRNFFAGNLTKQPAFVNRKWQIAEHLDNTDFIMNNSFFLGTYPGISKHMFKYAEKIIDSFFNGSRFHGSATNKFDRSNLNLD